ncbi:transcription repressor NadR [Clostridium bornimense]|nr:transcription repressor NadR [Clostridium bornimense]
MNSIERRQNIKELLGTNPIKGAELAQRFSVTRQVIVKDISILKAEGLEIISTSSGYILNNSIGIRKVIAVNHDENQIKDELEIIIKYGGVVEDITIEHPLYGEVTGKIMIKTLHDIDMFMDKIDKLNVSVLSKASGGVHLHTIYTDNKESMDKIINELIKSGYLISI